MNEMLRFVVADDDPYFRLLLGKEFISRPYYRMLFCAGDGAELVKMLTGQRPDLLLTDLYMPRMSGVEAIQLLRKTSNECPVIAYSSTYQDDVNNLLHGMNNVFYCERNTEVIMSIAESLFGRGKMTYDQYIREWKHRPASEILTEQKTLQFNATELQIISMTYDGYTNREIATQLSYSPRTIDTYVERLLNKLELRNKTDIARYAAENGICKIHCDLGLTGMCDRESIFGEKE